jgi:hypothetical protein
MSEAVLSGDAERAFSAMRALMDHMFEQSRKLAPYEAG